MYLRTFVLVVLSLSSLWSAAQQVADTTYNPEIKSRMYEYQQGPLVLIDEAHHNFHTKEGRYKSFANLLERDGYKVAANTELFSEESLAPAKILVISNALHKRNLRQWKLPNPPAFTDKEVKAVKEWVQKGGNLFLIADHMPMAGAAKTMGAAFGFQFTNGFVFDTISQGPAVFTRRDQSLISSVITDGRDGDEAVDHIATFTGQAFKIPSEATGILRFDSRYVNLLPERAWEFDETTEIYNVAGWYQGAFRTYGLGRVVVFGEAAMFSAQLAGPNKQKMGMNNPVAPENYQLLLNIIHWLDGKLN